VGGPPPSSQSLRQGQYVRAAAPYARERVWLALPMSDRAATPPDADPLTRRGGAFCRRPRPPGRSSLRVQRSDGKPHALPFEPVAARPRAHDQASRGRPFALPTFPIRFNVAMSEPPLDPWMTSSRGPFLTLNAGGPLSGIVTITALPEQGAHLTAMRTGGQSTANREQRPPRSRATTPPEHSLTPGPASSPPDINPTRPSSGGELGPRRRPLFPQLGPFGAVAVRTRAYARDAAPDGPSAP